MKRLSPAISIACAALFFSVGGVAQAHELAAGRALLHMGALAGTADVPQASCPTGVPVQTITVVNQANVRPVALAKVENAVAAQSMQLRAAWGTPCVQFGPGGWMVQLLIGGTVHGLHYGGPEPLAQVWTGGLDYPGWSGAFSHEVIETLVDPTADRSYYDPEHGVAGTMFGPVEVADPVGQAGYLLDGVGVADFVTPAYFAGALEEPQFGCDPSQNVPCGPLIASASAGSPYDEQGTVTAPWQTKWEEPWQER